jgi:hypothetical protein
MRKEVLVFIVLLGLISVVTAYHPFCDPDGLEEIQGVYIDGVCYDCGADDDVCPSDYGAVCGGIADDDCVYDPVGFWSLDGSTKFTGVFDVDPTVGRDVYLVVQNTGVDAGIDISFDIYEDDPVDDDDMGSILCTVLSDNSCNVTWTVDQDSLEPGYGSVGDQESTIDDLSEPGGILYFIADGIVSEDLKLNITYEIVEPEITSCSGYLDPDNCTDDNESVGDNNLPEDKEYSPDCFLTYDGDCVWTGTDECSQTTTTKKRTNPPNPDTCAEVEEVTCTYPASLEQKGSCTGGEQFFTIKYISDTPATCDSWETQPIPCPAKLRVPFFGIYGIIATLSIIALIYGFLIKRD